MSLLALSGTNSVSGGYEINNSCKFEADNAEKMTHTYDSAPTSQKKGTISMWFKRTEVGSNIGLFQFGDDASGDYLAVRWGRDIYGSGETYRMRIGGSTNITLDGDGAVRDTSAWYHIVIAIDTTQATASNRFRVYRNGAEVSMSTDNRSSLTQNTDMAIGENGKDIMIGEGVYKYNGYIAEVNYVDGQQLTPSDFGKYDSDSGIWIPKKYTGTYGNNGFYLDFSNASNLGEDQSGNNHDFTLSNITSADQATDTPTNNFTTFNTLKRWNQGRISFTEGATVVNTGVGNLWTTVSNNIGVNKGKWYWEGELYAGGGYLMFGQNPVVSTEININADWYLGKNANKSAGAGYYGSGADVYYEGGYVDSSANATGDIISVAMDCDNNKVHFAVNGVYTNSSNPVNNTNGFAMSDEYQYFAMATYIGSYAFKANFGGYTTISISSAASDANGYGTFEYAPPSGYYALCTKNLAEYG